MVSARNIVVGVIFLTLTLIIIVSVSTHGFVPQSKQPRKITSNLPIVVIRMDSETEVDVDKAEEYTTAWMDVIGTMGGENTFHMPYDDNAVTERYKIGIHIRGQSSRGAPKKPFAVKMYDYDEPELEKKDYPMFGFPKNNKWVLYSATVDPSLIRNQVAFELARGMGNFAPRMQFVELFIVPNNRTTDIFYPLHYNGIYLFSERIERDKNRVDIKKMKEEDNSGEALTGGYIVKVDKWGAGYQNMNEVFFTDFGNYVIVEPTDEVLTPEKYNYINDYVVKAESALMSPDFIAPSTGEHYTDLIDQLSYVDTVIMQELTKNIDAYRLSSFFTKDRNGKMKSGPVWDLDRTFGNSWGGLEVTDKWLVNNPTNSKYLYGVPRFWPAIFANKNFTSLMKERWTSLRQDAFSTEKVLSLIDTYQDQIEKKGAAYRDYNKWGNWYFPFFFWTTEEYSQYYIRQMREWTEGRLEWMDKAIQAF